MQSRQLSHLISNADTTARLLPEVITHVLRQMHETCPAHHNCVAAICCLLWWLTMVQTMVQYSSAAIRSVPVVVAPVWYQ